MEKPEKYYSIKELRDANLSKFKKGDIVGIFVGYEIHHFPSLIAEVEALGLEVLEDKYLNHIVKKGE